MKIYHFLPEKWALEALKTQRLKLSRYEDLNDPFELLAMSLEDKASRSIMIETKSKQNEKLRILCCSKRWVSPLLWGHYANKHTGVALELEVPDDSIMNITYAKERPSLDLAAIRETNDLTGVVKMYTTKYEQWSYEEEVRVQFTKEDFFCDEGMDFHKLGDEIKIVGVVLGPLNETSQEAIENSIPKGMEIEVTTTRIAFRSFHVVKQKAKPPFTLAGLSLKSAQYLHI